LDEILKGNALIRANFGIDPSIIEEKDWVELYQQAQWLERFRMKQQFEIMKSVFG